MKTIAIMKSQGFGFQKQNLFEIMEARYTNGSKERFVPTDTIYFLRRDLWSIFEATLLEVYKHRISHDV